jgi:D-threo-aldose 1-dehydrogenase
MRQRPFGRTGLEVSELVFGGGWVGGILIHQDDDTRRAALGRALDAGINWIDTAPSYGDGKSEEALGWLLQDVAERPYLSTKVRLDLTRLEDVQGQVEASLEQSLKRLRCDSVELFQLHNPIGPETSGERIGVDRVLRKGGVADALDRVREQGLTRFTGITAFGEAAACREVIASGRFDSAQIYYNMLNPSAGQDMPPAWRGHDLHGLIAACAAQGVAVMNIRVLAAGVLATEQRHGREIPMSDAAPIATEEARARAVFARLRDRSGTRAQTAIRFALANRDISCVLVGMAELAHLDEALAAAEMGPLPDEALRELREVYRSNFGLA